MIQRGLLLLMVVTSALGQNSTIRVDVQLSQVIVTVTDQQGRYVTDLTPNDFIIEVDGVRQKIAHFTQDSDTPVAVGIVIDTSGSMSLELGAAKQAAATFIHGMRPTDDFFLMTFASSASLRQDLTHNQEQMVRALDQVQSARGSTHLLSTVVNASTIARKSKNLKRALIVITDGDDNECRLSTEDFEQSLRRSELLAYGIRLPLHLGRAPTAGINMGQRSSVCRKMSGANQFFDVLATETGGRSFEVRPNSRTYDEDLDDIFSQISAELRGQYTLGFYPQKAARADAGTLHIRTTNPAYRVRYRRQVS